MQHHAVHVSRAELARPQRVVHGESSMAQSLRAQEAACAVLHVQQPFRERVVEDGQYARARIQRKNSEKKDILIHNVSFKQTS